MGLEVKGFLKNKILLNFHYIKYKGKKMSVIRIVNKMKKTVANIAGPSRGAKEEKVIKKSARRSPGATAAKSAIPRRAARSGR
tara:strand:+ start:66 stop:314 length:249 start_codon:yes stop_codon:yes gene_type:complete